MSSNTTFVSSGRCIFGFIKLSALLVCILTIAILQAKTLQIKVIDETGNEVKGHNDAENFDNSAEDDDEVQAWSTFKQFNGQYESRIDKPEEQVGAAEFFEQNGKGDLGKQVEKRQPASSQNDEGKSFGAKGENAGTDKTGCKTGKSDSEDRPGQMGQQGRMAQGELDQPSQQDQAGQSGQNGTKSGQDAASGFEKITGRANADEEFDSLEKVPCDPDSGYPYADEINPMYYFVCTKLGKDFIENRVKCNIGIFREDEGSCVFSKPAPPVPIAEDCKFHHQVISSPNDCRCYYRCSQIPDTDEFMLEDLCRDIC